MHAVPCGVNTFMHCVTHDKAGKASWTGHSGRGGGGGKCSMHGCLQPLAPTQDMTPSTRPQDRVLCAIAHKQFREMAPYTLGRGGAGVTCLVFTLVGAGPAQPDLVLPEVRRNVGDHPLHADALPHAVLSRHFAGQLWLQNQAQLLS